MGSKLPITILILLAVVLASANAKIIRMLAKRAFVDHDIAKFTFPSNPAITCASVSEANTYINGNQAQHTAHLNGNCYLSGSKVVLEVFMPTYFSLPIFIDFSNTNGANHVPTASSLPNNENSISIFRNLEPSYGLSTGVIKFKTCDNVATNQFWMWKPTYLGFNYVGCVDHNCNLNNAYYKFDYTCDHTISAPVEVEHFYNLGVTSTSPNRWSYCANENGGVALGENASSQLQAIVVDKTTTNAVGSVFTIHSGSQYAHQSCSLNKAGTNGVVAFRTGAGNGYYIIFALTGTGGGSHEIAETTINNCLYPSAVYNEADDELLLAWYQEGDKMYMRRVKADHTQLGATIEVATSMGSKRGQLVRSEDSKSNAVCFMSSNINGGIGLSNLNCRIFNDDLSEKVAQFMVSSANTVGADGARVTMAASDNGNFAVVYRRLNKLYIARFNSVGTIFYHDKLVGDYNAASSTFTANVAIRNDGVALVGWANDVMYLQAVNPNGSLRGTTRTTASDSTVTKTYPAFFNNGWAHLASLELSNVRVGGYNTPC